MADFTLTIPDDQVALVTSSLCQAAGFTDQVDFTDANAKAFVIQMIERVVNSVQAPPPPPPSAPISLGLS